MKTTSSPPRLSKSKRWLFIILANVFVLALIESTSYVALKILSKRGVAQGKKTSQLVDATDRNPEFVEFPFHPYLGHVAAPGRKIVTGKEGKRNMIETDAEGHSITPLSFEKPQIRIAVTGGSTMFGNGASDNAHTVPSQIERVIHEKLGVQAEVVNLGVGQYGTFQEMLSLDRYLASHKLDLILSIGGSVDTKASMKRRNTESAFLPDHVWNDVVPMVRRAEHGETFIVNFDTKLRAASSTFELIGRLTEGMGKQKEGDESDEQPDQKMSEEELLSNIPERAGLSVTNYSLMNTLAERYGAEFIMLLQPNPPVMPRGSLEDIAERRKQEGKGTLHQRFAYYNRYFQALRDAEKKYQFHDISDVFPEGNRKAFYYDATHYSDAGGALIAERVVEVIRPHIERITQQKKPAE